MTCKIALIGGGSYQWTKGFATDFFVRKSLDGSELCLMDVDPEALEIMNKVCVRIRDAAKCSWKVTATTRLDDALLGADYVCISISTGGLRAMDNDYRIPEKYGIYHTVGDTVGPAGISRTLRNVPVFVDIARKMEKLCPDAWMIHVTNPLTQLTRAVCSETKIKCVGLCHGVVGSLAFLADFLGAKFEDIDAICTGVNHFNWIRDISCQGEDVSQRLSLTAYMEYEGRRIAADSGGAKASFKTKTIDDEIWEILGAGSNFLHQINFELYDLFGAFPALAGDHIPDNLPYYLNSLETIEKHHLFRKGVLPQRQKLYELRKLCCAELADGVRALDAIELSREGLSGLIESLETNAICREAVAMPNRGQIENLPRDVVVETFAIASGSGINPIVSGGIPKGLLGWMQTIVDEEELSVEAALTGNRKLVQRAMTISPLLANKDAAASLADELLEANREHLPQFFG